MAAIDYIYLKNYNDYLTLKKWCQRQGEVTDNYGNKFRLTEYLLNLSQDVWDDWIQENKHDALKEYGDEPDFNAEDYASIPVMNAPVYVDIWMIRNCPIDFIQEYLKDLYSGSYNKTTFMRISGKTDYESIKSYDTVWDHNKRLGLRNPHFNIKWDIKHNFRAKMLWWWITVYDSEGKSCLYDPDTDSWVYPYELHNYSMNVCVKKYGNFNIRRFKRLFRNWNLSVGTVVHITVEGYGHRLFECSITIKK